MARYYVHGRQVRRTRLIAGFLFIAAALVAALAQSTPSPNGLGLVAVLLAALGLVVVWEATRTRSHDDG